MERRRGSCVTQSRVSSAVASKRLCFPHSSCRPAVLTPSRTVWRTKYNTRCLVSEISTRRSSVGGRGQSRSAWAAASRRPLGNPLPVLLLAAPSKASCCQGDGGDEAALWDALLGFVGVPAEVSSQPAKVYSIGPGVEASCDDCDFFDPEFAARATWVTCTNYLSSDAWKV